MSEISRDFASTSTTKIYPDWPRRGVKKGVEVKVKEGGVEWIFGHNPKPNIASRYRIEMLN